MYYIIDNIYVLICFSALAAQNSFDVHLSIGAFGPV